MAEDGNAVTDKYYVDDEQIEVRSGQWQISTEDDVEFALRRMGELERQISLNEERAVAAHAFVDRRLQQLNDKAAKGAAFFRSQVEVYATNHRAELLGSGKAKTRQFIYGSVAWRKSGGGLKVEDEAKLLEWCQRQGREELYELIPRPALAAIKGWATSQNIVPSGMERTPAEDRLHIVAIGAELVGGGRE